MEGNRIILSLGSNTERELNMERAKVLLQEIFKLITFSEPIETQPYGSLTGGAAFLNQVAIASTSLNANEVRNHLKFIEKTIGRCPEHKRQKMVLIDVDLLQWNNIILKPADLQMDYIQSGLQYLSGHMFS